MVEFDSPNAIRFNQSTKKVEIHGEPVESWHEFVTRLDVQHEIEMSLTECKQVFTYLAYKNKYNEPVSDWRIYPRGKPR